MAESIANTKKVAQGSCARLSPPPLKSSQGFKVFLQRAPLQPQAHLLPPLLQSSYSTLCYEIEVEFSPAVEIPTFKCHFNVSLQCDWTGKLDENDPSSFPDQESSTVTCCKLYQLPLTICLSFPSYLYQCVHFSELKKAGFF